jgi:hypothetical protein
MNENPHKIVQERSGQQIDSQKLREAVKQAVGQQDRKDNLFAATLLELAQRIERLESKPCKCR